MNVVVRLREMWLPTRRSERLVLSARLSRLAFQNRCARFLKADGWVALNAGSMEPVFRRNDVAVRLFFVCATEPILRTAFADWLEARAKLSCPVVVIHYGDLDEETEQVAESASIGLCDYRELGNLEQCAGTLVQHARREELRRNPELHGAIYDLHPPCTLQGWVSLRGPDGLIGGLKVSVLKGTHLLAVVVPDVVRLDLSGGDATPVGFTVACNGHVSAEDLLSNKIAAVATDASGKSYNLSVKIDPINSFVARTQLRNP